MKICIILDDSFMKSYERMQENQLFINHFSEIKFEQKNYSNYIDHFK